jgi:hypothetical protein
MIVVLTEIDLLFRILRAALKTLKISIPCVKHYVY